ncbi:hypothetical protein [Pseudomonas paraeruginosa]|uniref:hypothetical protein n=1 Tax=Pseudomonas aeruginosa TaxID=287 RepID=UPI00115E2D41|nr:hypothetical protein [Pseudomonas aeruginosa]
MNQSNGYRTDAELAIARQLGVFQGKAAKMWRGHEKEAVIALIRALDCGFHADSDTHSTHIRTVIPR